MRILLIIITCIISFQLWMEIQKENKKCKNQSISYDSLLCKNYQIMKQNDSLKAEIEACKWMGKREYYSINKNIK